jgi:hypothetical protein
MPSADRPAMPRYSVAVLMVLVLSVALALGWRAAGGGLYVMSTPSMAPATPVGSLVLDRPPGALAVGDTVTFRLEKNGPLYTHRIVAVLPGPRYETQGWAEAEPDPWRLSASQIVGEVRYQVWGLGWYYKVLPFWTVGLLLYLLVAPHLRRRARSAAAVVWWVALVAVPLVVWKPLVDSVVVASRRSGAGRLASRLINTGLFPVRYGVPGGTVPGVSPGGAIWVHGRAVGGHLAIEVAATLPWWGWVAVGALVFSPLLVHAARTLTERPAAIGASTALRHEPVGGGGWDATVGGTDGGKRELIIEGMWNR